MNPYAALGLSRNPFVAEAEPGVAAELWVDRELPDPPLLEPGSFVQVIGAKGAGKTSHLLRWRTAHQGPYRHVPPGADRMRPLPLAPVVYWDEADRVPRLLLRVMLAKASQIGAAVRCGTHRDLAGAAKAAGLRVSTYALPAIDGPAILDWARRRVANARLPSSARCWELDPSTAAALAAAHGDSWRAVGDRLHVLVALAAEREAGLANPLR